jgi:hypothetical protein
MSTSQMRDAVLRHVVDERSQLRAGKRSKRLARQSTIAAWLMSTAAAIRPATCLAAWGWGGSMPPPPPRRCRCCAAAEAPTGAAVGSRKWAWWRVAIGGAALLFVLQEVASWAFWGGGGLYFIQQGHAHIRSQGGPRSRWRRRRGRSQGPGGCAMPLAATYLPRTRRLCDFLLLFTPPSPADPTPRHA